jgi:predicted nucleic acid-binding protein
MLGHAGRIFRAMHGNASRLRDRLGPMNDVLIALTARESGATVITNNVLEFRRIAGKLPGLKVTAP